MQQMLERGTPLGIDPTLVLLRGLNFGVEHLYLDPSPNNEAGAAYFMFGPPGGEQALLVQVRAVLLMGPWCLRSRGMEWFPVCLRVGWHPPPHARIANHIACGYSGFMLLAR